MSSYPLHTSIFHVKNTNYSVAKKMVRKGTFWDWVEVPEDGHQLLIEVVETFLNKDNMDDDKVITTSSELIINFKHKTAKFGGSYRLVRESWDDWLNNPNNAFHGGESKNFIPLTFTWSCPSTAQSSGYFGFGVKFYPMIRLEIMKDIFELFQQGKLKVDMPDSLQYILDTSQLLLLPPDSTRNLGLKNDEHSLFSDDFDLCLCKENKEKLSYSQAKKVYIVLHIPIGQSYFEDYLNKHLKFEVLPDQDIYVNTGTLSARMAPGQRFNYDFHGELTFSMMAHKWEKELIEVELDSQFLKPLIPFISSYVYNNVTTYTDLVNEKFDLFNVS